METLLEYEKQSQELFNTNMTQTEVINLSKHSFEKRQYRLLKKNLNFWPYTRTIKDEDEEKQEIELANKELSVKNKTN